MSTVAVTLLSVSCILNTVSIVLVVNTVYRHLRNHQ